VFRRGDDGAEDLVQRCGGIDHHVRGAPGYVVIWPDENRAGAGCLGLLAPGAGRVWEPGPLPDGDDVEWDRPGLAKAIGRLPPRPDRKSTRLNSSHVAISYAVFCLKKKKSSAQASAP